MKYDTKKYYTKLARFSPESLEWLILFPYKIGGKMEAIIEKF